MLVTVLATCLAGLFAMPAVAAPSATETAKDRAAVARAVEQFQEAQKKSADIDARIADTSAGLDQAVARERAARSLLRSRVTAMYRSADVGLVSALLSAPTLQDFVTRWDVLSRIARQDARIVRDLKAARTETERSAQQLLELQAREARALDEMADRVARAKKELATSEAALREYQAQTAASAKAASGKAPGAAPSPAGDPTPQLSGSGAWETAVASHYGRNFTGRGASGEDIGPYSMIVAHKSLPFGTLVELEYNGRRAVARVADRGPYTEGRTFDLGPGVIRVLGFSGVHEVRYRIITR